LIFVGNIFFWLKLCQYAGIYIHNFQILAAAFDTIDHNILVTRNIHFSCSKNKIKFGQSKEKR